MTMSMVTCMAIAIHRYKMITGLQNKGETTRPAIVVLLTWISSLGPASIFLYVMVLQGVYDPDYGILLHEVCIEVWPFAWGKEFLTGFTIAEQYIAPVVTISIVHFRLLRFIESNRMNRKQSVKVNNDNKRHNRTTTLLVTVTASYMLCWAPYHVFHMLNSYTLVFEDDTQLLYMLFGVVHMIAMCSAICNSMLYGFMNDNLRPAILSLCEDMFCRCKSTSNAGMELRVISQRK